MNITTEDILTTLQTVIDPNTGADYISQKSVQNLQVEGSRVSLDVLLGYPAASQHERIQKQIEDALKKSCPDIREVVCHVRSQIIAHQVQKGLELLPQVKNIIAVASGKGGVGKSTTAANLALALHAEGANVGILDADIYGPSQAMMMGVDGRPESNDGKTMEPLENHGVQVMSIGLLVDADNALIWRGPMATQALQQMLVQTNWKALDYLIVDMPPGTGDIALTLAQKVPITGAVIVTTPQDIALLDAQRGFKMFEQVGIAVLGIIENMAVHICSNCGHAEHIFGEGGAQRMSQKYDIPYLGGLPLTLAIREQADAGTPTVVHAPQSPEAKAYRAIALKIAAEIALRPRDYSAIMPKVKVTS
ncbi:iron-sulfur cluster carrier protein ApbC [Saezia sanguinis]|uniref:iron-sulfur cluster carrier protein ApbC n=1 Tax=Saezia sanguinis TaxID=1965230 RepID=UPI003043CF21